MKHEDGESTDSRRSFTQSFDGHGVAMTRFEYTQWGAKARAVRGNELPHAKLTPEKVRAIRANTEGLTAKQLAAAIGVHWRTIEKVRSYEAWSHV